ncbi:MAG: hydrogenase maturation protease [Sulfurovaceae bacterium]
MHELTILGIGNILQGDDGIGVYAIIEETRSLIILDSIEIDDAPGSIYMIPANELGGYGINCGGAHEIGVLECLDMLELQGKELPNATVIGIIPQEIDLHVGLSTPLKEHFDDYIKTVISAITELDFKIEKREKQYSLQEIIDRFKD